MNYRFYWKYGETPFNSVNVLLMNLGGLVLIFMAVWSHYAASRWSNADPGFIQWHHFRNEEELKHVEDKQKWSDAAYRRSRHEKETRIEQSQDDMDTVSAKAAIYDNQCKKCGAIKITGTHHCSRC